MPELNLSVVTPVYNEEAVIGKFYERLKKVLSSTGLNYQVIFVNDGSTDGSAEILEKIKSGDPSVRVLTFSRNFGHQIAVKAGIDHARGAAVMIMDSDLQDPPETIPDFLAKWREGFDVVYGVRVKREGESFFKKITASLYYKFLRKITGMDLPLETGDFRLISQRVASVLRNIQERNPYLRGLVAWAGFRQTGIPIERQARFAGKTKYSLRRMIRLAWSGVAHFSFLPLQLAGFAGALVMLFCFAWLVRALCLSFSGEIDAFQGAGFAALFFLGAVQLLSIGVLGSYLGRTYDESRSRPLYVLTETEPEAR